MSDPAPVDAAVTRTAGLPPPPSKLGSMDALVRTMLLEAADGEKGGREERERANQSNRDYGEGGRAGAAEEGGLD